MSHSRLLVSFLPLALALLGIYLIFNAWIVHKYYVFPSILCWCTGLITGAVLAFASQKKAEKILSAAGAIANLSIVTLLLLFVASAARA